MPRGKKKKIFCFFGGEVFFHTVCMGPKIESALRFLSEGGKEVIITSCEKLADAVNGNSGTHIYSET